MPSVEAFIDHYLHRTTPQKDYQQILPAGELESSTNALDAASSQVLNQQHDRTSYGASRAREEDGRRALRFGERRRWTKWKILSLVQLIITTDELWAGQGCHKNS